jgi:acetolactate synthase regulatory subunit
MEVCNLDGTVRPVPVEELHPGQYVLSMDFESKPVCKEVVRNIRHSGEAESIKMTTKQLDDANFTQNLTVTAEHAMFTLREPGEFPVAVRADAMSVGDLLMQQSGLAIITELDVVKLQNWNHLVTSTGDVLANGIYTSTICKDYVGTRDNQIFAHDALALWRRDHASLITS